MKAEPTSTPDNSAAGVEPRRGRWLVLLAVLAIGAGAAMFLNPARPVGSGATGAAREELDGLSARVDDLREIAAEHRAGGRWDAAEEALDEAVALQRELTERFGDAPEGAVSRLEAVETELQEVRAEPVVAEIARLDAQAAEQLRKRDARQAERLIAEAAEGMARAAADFPRAAAVKGELSERLQFLRQRQGELAWLQDLAYEGFVNEADAPEEVRLETGPGWELYKRVMGPGSGATGAEVREFCRRLGWVLGRRVRPATEGGAARSSVQVVVELEAGH